MRINENEGLSELQVRCLSAILPRLNLRLNFQVEDMASLTKADIRKIRKKRARLKRKMTCRFCPDGRIPRPVYVDYKDVKTIKQLIDREGRILPRRRTGTSAIYQRAVRRAVMRARFIGLIPYIAEE